MIEVWSDVLGYEGLYEVSNFGRVRRNGKILKPAMMRNGYLRVDLYKNGIAKHSALHRLVALAFLPNPDNLPYINHKDEDKTNNSIDNLEWCTPLYNSNYGKSRQKISESKYKPVLQYDLNGKFIKEYPSIQKAAEELSISATHISHVCKGSRNKTGGYIWKYKE